jgi:hypothetical protein
MVKRYALAIGIAGIAGLGTWIATHRYASRRRDLDDDRAAEIIRRFAPALHEVWASQIKAAQ